MQATILAPFIKRGGVVQEILDKDLMISLQEYGLARLTASDQAVKHLSRRRSTVDVISEKDFHRSVRWICGLMRIDA